jgi:hypothetical protein
MTAIAVPLTTAIINRINRREGEIRETGKTMLLLAKEQGEDLFALKEGAHGHFKEVVERETVVSYVQAGKYMRVAKRFAEFVPQDKFDLTLGINAFLAQFAEEQPAKRKARPSFTREDAEYALKIHTLAERGATEGERDAAAGKLDNLAQQFGRSAEKLIKDAEALCPDLRYAPKELETRTRLLEPYMNFTREELLETIYVFLSEILHEMRYGKN